MAMARSRSAIAIAERVDDAACAREAHRGAGTTAMLSGDLPMARLALATAYDLATAAGDAYPAALALLDLGLAATYGGDDPAAADYERRLHLHAAGTGAPSLLACAHYLSGERHADREPDAAAEHLSKAVELADSVDDRFLAGVARHTLLTSTKRHHDPNADLSGFGALIDHWHAVGTWTQLWLALHTLIEALSRHERHREVALLLGAHASSTTAPRASAWMLNGWGSTTEEVAHAQLGDSFDSLSAEGGRGGDELAVALGRRLTRSA